jgi:hypothetical protein
MAWSDPRTWVDDELITDTILNEHVRDNLNALKDPPTALYDVNEGADYTTTSSSFADVDATNLALTITTGGAHDIMIGFTGSVDHSAAGLVYFDLDLDGVLQGGDDGIGVIQFGTSAVVHLVSFVYLIQNVTAASHTIKLQWKVSTGTATLYAGAGTSTFDVHPQFWVREVS